MPIKMFDKGDQVRRLQSALVRRGYLPAITAQGRPNIDGDFGKLTSAALMSFQLEMVRAGKLEADEANGHTAGQRTQALLFDDPVPAFCKPDWPAEPEFKALGSQAARQTFGDFSYTPRTAPNRSGYPIRIDPAWLRENLVTDVIPQIDGLPLYSPNGTQISSGRVTLHRLAMPVFKAWLAECDELGLISLLRTYDGGFNPRFQRGSLTHISLHALGAALDFNAWANPMGKKPAAMGEDGCLLPLVDVASRHGIYWGGFWPGSRVDGMHFELAVL